MKRSATEDRGPGTGSYLDYLRKTFPKTWTVEPKHIRLIAEHVDAVRRKEIDRLAIFMPPRHGKTESVTVRAPVYWLENDRTANVLITGYNERFARRLGRKARNVARGRFSLAEDKTASDEWMLPEGGGLMARGVGSPPTGTGYNLIVIDDPIRKREDAESEVYREKVWDWYTDDLYTRREPGCAIILVMTLWHEDDLGARAIASEPGAWTVLKLPALAEANDPMGRLEGAALWPERFNVAALTRTREVMSQNEGLRGWEALYQQNPTPREGIFFLVDKLTIVDAAPAGLQMCRGWDLAATAGGGNRTAGIKIGRSPDGQWFIVDAKYGQWDSDTVRRTIRQTSELDGTNTKIHGPQDPGQAGKDQAASYIRLLSGFNVKWEVVSGQKTTRAEPLAAQVNAGNVKLVRGPWNHDLIEEFRAFPQGKTDDMVDAASDAFTELNSGGWAQDAGLREWMLTR